MTSWPDKPLIRIIHGEEDAYPIRNTLATRDGDSYIVAIGSRAGNPISRDYATDHIFEWEEVTAVPTAALKHLQQALQGIDMATSLAEIVQEVLACLPANKPSALDRAVTRVKDIADAPMVDAETLPADRLSLLLDALASIQSAAHKTAPLTMVTRICADWVQADKEEVVAVEQMRSRARSMPEVIGSDPAKFLVLAGIVGETASMLGDGHPSVSGELINAGTYALAWAAQIIEEEDR